MDIYLGMLRDLGQRLGEHIGCRGGVDDGHCVRGWGERKGEHLDIYGSLYI